MADKAKILQNAQHYMVKGQIDKAIVEWQKLISESPNDGNIYNTIGDLFLKKNDLPKAVSAYLKGAEVFHAAGFSLKTIAIYKKLIKQDPKRLDILIKLGDLNAERGLTNNAIEDYLSAAKQYSQEGDVKEALGVYRKIADLDPSNTATRMKLADLCLKEGLQQQAIDEFLKVAESYLKTNQSKEAELLCERILKLDPNNEGVRKLRGQPSESHEVPPVSEAVSSVSPVVPTVEAPPSSENLLSQIDGLIEKGLLDEARKLLNQFMKENPADPVGPYKLGTILLKTGKKEEAFTQFKDAVDQFVVKGEYGQAGKLMKDYLEVDPDHVEAHFKLAEVYTKGNNPHLAVSSYAHVIDDYLASGEIVKAKDLYDKIKTLDPQHRDVRRLRHSCETAEVPQPPIAVPVETNLVPETVPKPLSASHPSLSSTEEVPSPVAPVVIADPAVLNSLLTEVEVYLKYGLSVKAIEQIQQVLAIDPDNEIAHKKLKDIYKDEGQTSKIIEECFNLIEIYKKTGNQANLEAILEEAKSLDPNNPRIRELTDLSPALESGRMNAILQEEPVASEVIPSSLMGNRVGREESAEGPSQAEIASDSFQEKGDVSERLAEADFYYQQGLRDEAKKMYELILTLKQDQPTAIEKLEAIVTEETIEKQKKSRPIIDSRANEKVKPNLDSPLKSKGIPPSAAPAPKTPPPAKVKSPDEAQLDNELEKSFAPFMGEGSEESEIESPEMKTEKISFPLKEEKEEFVDLSGIFDEAVQTDIAGPAPADFAEETTVSEQLDHIFTEFQKDAEQVVDDIDFETHYNLGIAYKEMGLLTEAIVEFKQAMNAADRFIDSSQMLAACHQENGNNQEAIEYLDRALSDSRCEEAQALWLRYDMASLYEKESRLEEALSLFNQIARSDRNFKDVEQRIQNLEGQLGKPGKKIQGTKDAGEEDEDLDVMMDRMFGESSPGTKSNKTQSGTIEDSKKKDRISYL